MFKSWERNLTLEDLPSEDIRIIADFYGVRFALRLMKDLPGVTISIPSSGLKKIRNDYICRNYHGSKKSRLKLALECEVTECYIKRLAWLHSKKDYSERLAS